MVRTGKVASMIVNRLSFIIILYVLLHYLSVFWICHSSLCTLKIPFPNLSNNLPIFRIIGVKIVSFYD